MSNMSGVSKTIIIPDGDDDYYYEELNYEAGNQQSLVEEISPARREVHRSRVSNRGQHKREVNVKMRQPHNLHVQNEEKGSKKRTNEEKRKTWDLPSTSKQAVVASDLKRFNHKNDITTPSYQTAQTSKNSMSPEVDTTAKTNKKMKSRTQMKNTQSNQSKKKEVPWSAIVHSISTNPRNAVKNANIDMTNEEPEDLSKERGSNLAKSLDADQQFALEEPSVERGRKDTANEADHHGSDMHIVPVIEYAQAECMSTSSQSSEENSALETQDLSVNKSKVLCYNEHETKADSAQTSENPQISVINSNPMEPVPSPPSQIEPAPTEQQQNEAQQIYLGMVQQPLNVNIEDQLEVTAGQVWNVAGTQTSQLPQESVQLSISVGDNVRIITPCALVQPVEVRGILQTPQSEASSTMVANGTPLQLNIANVNINIILPQSVNSIIHDLIPVQPSRNTVTGQGLLALAQPQQASTNNMQNYEMISPTTTVQQETQQMRPMQVAPAQIHSAYSTYSVQSNLMPRMATGARRICHSNNQGLLRRDPYLPNYPGVPHQNILRQNTNHWSHHHPDSSDYHPVPYNHHIPRYMSRPPLPPYHISNRCDCNHCPQTHNPYNRTYNASNVMVNPRQPTHDHNYPLNLQARRHPKS